jgi:hypothetical protein
LPLFEKTRIEIYVPVNPSPPYRRLLAELRRELTFAFGGCTVVPGLRGAYLSHSGEVVEDGIALLYTDAPLSPVTDAELIADYAAALRRAAHRALNEEAILVAIQAVGHSED